MTVPYWVPTEQLVKDKADFARKGIGRGKPIVVMEYENGILIVGENPSGSLHKIGEVYDQIAFAGVGRVNEFETLRVGGIRYADVKGYSYGRMDVTAKGLAYAYSQTLGQIFTHDVKPYEIEVLVAEVGGEDRSNELYRVQFDGTLQDIDSFGAMGANQDQLTSALSEHFDPTSTLAVAVAQAAVVIESAESREIPADDWEAAVLDRTLGRRKFRRLTPDEIAAARS
ncbi:MAG TPA: proteasome subunit alpha [Acidimicrobiia bacterium]|jgi:proteasome alpha subunit